MASMRKKIDLPAKTCPVCRRTIVWSKKWARAWSEVHHCSDACRSRRAAREVVVRFHATGVGA